MNQKSRLIDQYKLKILCDSLCDQIEEFLDLYHIDYKYANRMITMSCPIHGGDNESAINIYPEGDTYRGNWKCRTHNCHEIFKGSIIGFVRGILSREQLNWTKNGDPMVSFEDTITFIEKFLNKSLKDIKVSKTFKEKQKFSSMIGYMQKSIDEPDSKITRNQIIKKLEIPAQYYLDRGYSAEILRKYDVGLCKEQHKSMSNRVVVPIYDNSYSYMVGCTGRSILPVCDKCELYHTGACPDPAYAYLYSKWKHSFGSKTENHLYNMWFAKKYIQDSATAIIVESPGNVWKLEENGIHNAVAIFGTNMSDFQKILLDGSGAMNLIILTDNDGPGDIAAEKIIKKCQNTYKTYRLKISKNDVAELSSEEIEIEIKEAIQKLRL
jgi:5S rRNA maturation endonuclease (ribonuclease M5)